ncbi:MAG: LacI family DNA-binding transcriptional regulator [Luteolibacter sp.]
MTHFQSSEPRVTLLDIARKLGVSNATVSLALNGHPRISAATRQRVIKTAEELGYRPDPMLSALAKHRSKRRGKEAIHSEIAWISGADSRELSIGAGDISLCGETVVSIAERSGYRLERYLINSEMGYERLDQILSARGVNGILLAPLPENGNWRNFPWEKYAVVRFGNEQLDIPGHRICPDHVENMKTAFQKIREKGYQRIGYIAGAAALPGAELREAGYCLAQKKMDDSHWIPVFHQQTDDDRSPRRRFTEWMNQYRPDAIISEYGELEETLVEEGWAPNSLGIAYTSAKSDGERAGVCWNLENIGKVGFQLLDTQISVGHRGSPEITQTILISGTWIEGTSLPEKSALAKSRKRKAAAH